MISPLLSAFRTKLSLSDRDSELSSGDGTSRDVDMPSGAGCDISVFGRLVCRRGFRSMYPVVMRGLLTAVLMLVAALLAQAQTPEDTAYVAARDQAVAALEARHRSLPPSTGEMAWVREEQAVEGRLEARLQDVMARFRLPKGFSVIGFHPQPLCCGTSAGALDGLVLSNGRNRAVVTTEGILRLWLGGGDPVRALESDGIGYLRALNADAPVRIFAPLPVTRPAGTDLAIARLVIKGTESARLPLHIVVAIVRNGLVYLSLFPASLEPSDATTPCDVLWREASERYRSADDLDTRRDINAETGEQLGRCVKAHEGQLLFPGLGRRAQRAVNALAADGPA
jgi:hypothetical protein